MDTNWLNLSYPPPETKFNTSEKRALEDLPGPLPGPLLPKTQCKLNPEPEPEPEPNPEPIQHNKISIVCMPRTINVKHLVNASEKLKDQHDFQAKFGE